MVTYNHVNFIAQAIESVLMQETNFEYELVIGEDYSTDGTREIVKSYAEKYPDKIRTLLHPHNLGSGIKGVKNGRLNLIATLKACKGEYIAFLEGDDYWTNPLKLQKQVEFLEKHSDYVGSFHDTELLYEEGQPIKTGILKDWKEQLDVSLEDIVSPVTPFHTSSFVVKHKVIEKLPKQFVRFQSGDWTFYIISAAQGQFRRIPEYMSSCRRHKGGITRTKSHQGVKFYLGRIYMFRSLKKHVKNMIKEEFDTTIHFFEHKLIDFSLLNKDRLLPSLQDIKLFMIDCGIITTSKILFRIIVVNLKRIISPLLPIVLKKFIHDLKKILNNNKNKLINDEFT